MVDNAGVMIAAVTATWGVVLYVIRAELADKVGAVAARIAGHERECEQRRKNDDEFRADIKAHLIRIEEKIDHRGGK